MPLILPPLTVAHHLIDAGFVGWRVVTGGAVITAESGRDAYAVHVVDREFRDDGSHNPAYRSLDVGMGQPNTFWWPIFTIAELLDPAGNAAAMRYIWLDGFNDATGSWESRVDQAWRAWTTYRNGDHRPYLPAAIEAAREVGAID